MQHPFSLTEKLTMLEEAPHSIALPVKDIGISEYFKTDIESPG
jgi:hypothetical protein